MAELVEAGKIRHWGLSNETPYGVCEFISVCKQHGLPPPVSVQKEATCRGTHAPHVPHGTHMLPTLHIRYTLVTACHT